VKRYALLAKKTVFMLSVLSLMLLFYGQPAQADLVINGSFENTTGFVDTYGQDAMSLPNGSTTITGWTVINEEIAWIGPAHSLQIKASQGSYFLDLAGYHNYSPYGGVQQSVSTVLEHSYLLAFDLGSSIITLLPSAITATAGSTAQTFTSTNTSSSNAWEHFVLAFTATGPTTTISFIGYQAGPLNDGYYIGLDNITVSAAPLPPSVLLMGSGLLGLMSRRRHKS
jgi:hypothetical protein